MIIVLSAGNRRRLKMGESIGMEEVFERFKEIEKRLSLLEQAAGLNGEGLNRPAIEMRLTLPEADIGGLHFNKHEVNAVFEKKADGWRRSRDILFLSARNVKDDNSRDILTKYLESDAVKDCFITGLSNTGIGGYARDDIEISLPVENEGVKRYNEYAFWYWLNNKYSRTVSSLSTPKVTPEPAARLRWAAAPSASE
jgi:hypothetical protein